jgi:hypothetical protein
METHFLYCTHGGEEIIFHDVVWDAFMFIVRDVWFHVNKLMFFCCISFRFLNDELILCYCQ